MDPIVFLLGFVVLPSRTSRSKLYVVLILRIKHACANFATRLMLVINDGSLESWVLSCAGMRRVSNAGFCQRYHNGVGCKFQFQYQEAGHHRRGEGDARGSLPEHSILCRHHGRPLSSGLCWWSPNHHSFREEGFDFRKHLGSIRKSPATEYQHGPIHELVCYLRHESS